MLRCASYCSFIPAWLFLSPGNLFNQCAYGTAQYREGIYTAFQQTFFDPILRTFEERAGMKVKILKDIKAIRAAITVNHVTAEKQYPQNKKIKSIIPQNPSVLALCRAPIGKSLPTRCNKIEETWPFFSARNQVPATYTVREQAAEPLSSYRESIGRGLKN